MDFLTSLQERLVGFGAFLGFAWRRFNEDKCLRMAASLSYTSLLAVVPLTAIAFAMLAAFPVFEGVRDTFQNVLFANFLPQSAEAMREYFDKFVGNAASLTAVGIIGLALTAVLLLGTIEGSMNAIFRVRKPRAIMPRLLVFWALITLGPLLMGASFSLSTYFFAATKWAGVDMESGILNELTQLLPTILVMVALTFFYMIIPNRPVSPRAALLGGILAGFLFALTRKLFGLYVTGFPTYQTIYGAVSVLPILLIWMYLNWAIVLFGAVMTASFGEWLASGGRPLYGRLEGGRRLMLALEILRAVHHKACTKGGGIKRRKLLQMTGVSEMAIDDILGRMKDHKILLRAENREWLIARELDTLNLNDMLRVLEIGIQPKDMTLDGPGWRHRLSEQVHALAEAQTDIGNTPLSDIFGTDPDEETAATDVTPTDLRTVG